MRTRGPGRGVLLTLIRGPLRAAILFRRPRLLPPRHPPTATLIALAAVGRAGSGARRGPDRSDRSAGRAGREASAETPARLSRRVERPGDGAARGAGRRWPGRLLRGKVAEAATFPGSPESIDHTGMQRRAGPLRPFIATASGPLPRVDPG